MKRTILGTIALFAFVGTSGATTYVADANSGNDAAQGTIDQPFQSLGMCLASLQAAGDVCELRAGTYYAPSTDPGLMPSGTPGQPIAVQAHADEHVVIRQGQALTGWTRVTGNLWKVPFADYNLVVKSQISRSKNVPGSFFERGVRLWNDATPLPEACFPNLSGGANSFHSMLVAESGSNTNLIKSSQIQSRWNLKDARVVVSARQHLASHSLPITSSSGGQVNFLGDWPWAVAQNAWFYLEGGKDLIDTAWEWAADSVNKLIYLQTDGSDPNTLPLRIQTSSSAFALRNVSNWVIHDLEFQGVVPTTIGQVKRIQYHHLTIHEPGILRFNDKLWDYLQVAGLVLGDSSRIHHSTIDGCDGRCVDMNGRSDTVDNCTIRNGGRLGQFEGAISVTSPNAVVLRNDIFGSGSDGITTVTTSSDNLLVRRNWITGSGMVGSDAAGIRMSSHAGINRVDSNLVSGTRPGALAPPGSNSIGGAGVFLDDASQLNDVLFNVFTDMGTGVVLNCDASSDNFTSKYNRAGNNTGINLGSFANIREVGDLTGTKFADNILAGPLTTSPTNIMYPVLGTTARIADLGSMGFEYYISLPAGQAPYLTDPVHLDFRPQAYSPVIDAGIVYLQNQTYYGTAPDHGAVESGSKQWVFGVYDDPPKFVCNPALCFEDATLWTPIWGTYAVLSNSIDRVDGYAAMSMIPNGYTWLESPYMDQSVAKGFRLLAISFKMSSMINPYYYGSVSIFLDCPSMGVWNQQVGQIDLTGLPLGIWNTKALLIDPALGGLLAGKTFSDFRMRLAVNIPAGSGPVIFDYMRLLP
jgi:hypothetical protein